MSGLLDCLFHSSFKALGGEAQLAAGAAVAWLGKPAHGIFDLDAAFRTTHFNDFVFHSRLLLVHAGTDTTPLPFEQPLLQKANKCRTCKLYLMILLTEHPDCSRIQACG